MIRCTVDRPVIPPDGQTGMDIQTADISRLERYRLLTQVVVPRPIAWVISGEESQGSEAVVWNLAPYSYFNIVSSEPPVVVLGFNSEAHEKGVKDTIRNLRSKPEFTISMPHAELAESVTQTSRNFPSGVSEAVECGIELADWHGWSAPRVAQARVSLACRLIDEVDIGSLTQVLAVARIERVWLDRHVVTGSDGSFRIDLDELDPLARVGGGRFVQLRHPFKA